MITDGLIDETEKAIRVLRRFNADIEDMERRIESLKNTPDIEIAIHKQNSIDKIDITCGEFLSILEPRLSRLRLGRTSIRNLIEEQMRTI